MADTERFKQAAARAVVDRVRTGMVLGLGTGSTVRYVLEEIGERIQRGRLADIVGVPTSDATAEVAFRVGIALTQVGHSPIALAIDGADEIAPDLSLTKGGGGALMREKIVAAAAAVFIVVADESKVVDHLGSTFPIPIEVARFGVEGTLGQLRRFGNPTLRITDDEPLVTDNGNYVVDLGVDPIDNPVRFNERLAVLPGVLDTGIFTGLATEALVAGPGGVRSLTPR